MVFSRTGGPVKPERHRISSVGRSWPSARARTATRPLRSTVTGALCSSAPGRRSRACSRKRASSGASRSRVCGSPVAPMRSSTRGKRASAWIAKSDKHNPPEVTPRRSSRDLPIIGLPALLQLVGWSEAHRHLAHRGGSACVNIESSCPPRAGPTPKPSVLLSHLWPALADEDRRRTLQALSRVVAQQLMSPPTWPEVTHERP